MCGIFGYASKQAIDRDAFDAALLTLSCRGPDARSIREYSPPGASLMLGHTRLAVVGPSPAGNHPMEGHRTSIVFNGEIYGFSSR